MNYLLIDNTGVILHISETVSYQENGNVLVDHDTLAYAAICVDRVIEIPEVPEGVLAMKWCCVDGEFSLNPNYIEPEEPTDWDYALQILNGEADYDGE